MLTQGKCEYTHSPSQKGSSSKKKISSHKYRDSFFKSEKKPRRDNSTAVVSHRSSLTLLEERKDAFGTPITKGSRKHKVTFIDDIKKTNKADISEIKEAENQTPKEENKYVIRIKKSNEEKEDSKETIQRREEGEIVKCRGCIIF